SCSNPPGPVRRTRSTPPESDHWLRLPCRLTTRFVPWPLLQSARQQTPLPPRPANPLGTAVGFWISSALPLDRSLVAGIQQGMNSAGTPKGGYWDQHGPDQDEEQPGLNQPVKMLRSARLNRSYYHSASWEVEYLILVAAVAHSALPLTIDH